MVTHPRDIQDRISFRKACLSWGMDVLRPEGWEEKNSY